MTELPLIFVGGLLGSYHCIGMCGPLALALGVTEEGLVANLRRQLVFSAGRILTYGFGGTLAAYAGWWLGRWPAAAFNAQAVLAIVAGAALVLLGLAGAGLVPQLRFGRFAPQSCAAAKGLKTLLTAPGLGSAFLAGVFTGFIPCGLVYAFLAVAASTGDVLRGWLTMVAFGAGTVPLMVLAGSSGSLISVAARARVLRIAAGCVVVVGVISIARGAGYLSLSSGGLPASCPFCHSGAAMPGAARN
jgi:sulfite exporter TauE/SafE